MRPKFVFVYVLIFIFSNEMMAQGWLTGFNYRKRITISGSTGAGNYYQILLKVGESVGASGAHFHLEGHCANFPNDIRFADDDSITQLSYWLEKTTGSSPNRVGYFWVKVNDNLDNNRNIFVYYGNSSAGSASNGELTFIFFDDFESGFNSTKWSRTDSNDVYVSGDIMQL